MNKYNEKGQVVIIMLMVMLIALAVGLAVIGRSLNDISTSTKVEDSTRAFSAAEAGIERALKEDFSTPSSSLSINYFTNQANALVNIYTIPAATRALEYPKIGKASFAEFWLADPSKDQNLDGVADAYYTQPSFDLYFGVPQTYTNAEDKPAIEVRVFYLNGVNKIDSTTSYFDTNSTRWTTNGFSPCTPDPSGNANTIVTNDGSSASFYCKVTVNSYPVALPNFYPILARVRLLYSNINHPMALQPTGGASLPHQVNIYRSVGTVGNIQRQLEVFRQKYVMPHFFDYTLFAASSINK